LLLVHEIGCSGAIVYFTDFVDLAGEFQNTFRGGGLASIHVREYANVSVIAKVGHDLLVYPNVKNATANIVVRWAP
jgi:hypothetical protein